MKVSPFCQDSFFSNCILANTVICTFHYAVASPLPPQYTPESIFPFVTLPSVVTQALQRHGINENITWKTSRDALTRARSYGADET